MIIGSREQEPAHAVLAEIDDRLDSGARQRCVDRTWNPVMLTQKLRQRRDLSGDPPICRVDHEQIHRARFDDLGETAEVTDSGSSTEGDFPWQSGPEPQVERIW
jgi:hypothetical protein